MKKAVLIILILTIISVAMFSSTVMADSYAKPSKSRQALLMNENGARIRFEIGRAHV